jgi:hypothetical protein
MMSMVVDPRSAVSFTQGNGMGKHSSSFGAAGTTFGYQWQGHNILQGDRYALLQQRSAYYECKQHNQKKWDFDGRAVDIRVGTPGVQGFVGMEKPMTAIPFSHRRPSAPMRLAKIITDRFTSMLFGESMFPHFKTVGDDKTEGFVQALSKAGKLPVKMVLARNIGGSTGSVGLSWCFHEGKPRYGVHSPKNIFVHSWDDRSELIPKHVSEVYMYFEPQWDPKRKCFGNKYFWHRRDWTPDWDIVFKPMEFAPDKQTFWEPDVAKSVNHKDGLCHFVWIQNLPTEEMDGLPDYDGVYDKLDEIDIISSVISRGTKVNLDPTLVLKVDADLVARKPIQKGSDNSLNVGLSGDASYLELQGSSINIGITVLDRLIRATFDECQCVLADADKLAAQGLSSVAIRMIYGPMIAKSNLHREQYGTGLERLLEPQIVIAKKRSSVLIHVQDADGTPQMDEQGAPVVGKEQLQLPPTVTTEADPMTGEEIVVRTPVEPGDATDIELQWPPYFPANPTEQSAIVTTLQTATGGKTFLSAETAMEIATQAFGVDPAQEKKRLDEQANKAHAQEAAMTPGTGGEVGAPGELPEGADPTDPNAPPPDGAPPGGGEAAPSLEEIEGAAPATPGAPVAGEAPATPPKPDWGGGGGGGKPPFGKGGGKFGGKPFGKKFGR